MLAHLGRRFRRNRDRGLTIYLHFPCFDGVASAALASELVRARAQLELQTVVPVNYELRSQWLATRLDKHSAIVDFLFHPDAEYWADHHPTTFLDDASKEKFYAAGSKDKMLYDPSAQSCTSLLWNACRRVVSDQQRFSELVHWANKIDSAAYDSVQEAVLGEAPALQINKSLFINPDRKYCDFLVRSIWAKDLAETARSAEVVKRYTTAAKRIARGVKVAREALEVTDDIAVLRLAERPDTIVSRYAPYLFCPEARYSIICFRSSRTTKITAMRNPWLHFRSIALGPLFAKFGGGGHQRVGSVVLDNDRAQTEHILNLLMQKLKEHPVNVPQGEGAYA